jgi:hypothetical protein
MIFFLLTIVDHQRLALGCNQWWLMKSASNGNQTLGTYLDNNNNHRITTIRSLKKFHRKSYVGSNNLENKPEDHGLRYQYSYQ